MRSIRVKILVWSLAMLMVSLGAFVWISQSVVGPSLAEVFGRMQEYQLHEAVTAFEQGGPAGLTRHLEEARRFFGGTYYLIDPSGRDLVTGESRAALLGDMHATRWAHRRQDDTMILTIASVDGRYLLLTVQPAFPVATFLAYYLLLMAAVGVLFWLLAVNIASPLRHLAGAVERFGRGDRAVRVSSSRRDEIGELGRAFNDMAGRIETLLTAEHQLLQDVSHELRSPLARLTFAAELVRKTQDRDAAAARLRREIDRLSELVSALLEMTSAEGDPSGRKREDVCLSDLLHEVCEACEMDTAARDCLVALDAPEHARVSADGELLRRAFENILRNAIRYAPPGSTVEVKMTADPAGAVVSMRDYGPGVPDDLLPKIFSPFFRVDASRDENTGGTGLGLAIARRAVHIHHGEVAAVNAAPGLLVKVTLPALDDRQPLPPSPPARS